MKVFQNFKNDKINWLIKQNYSWSALNFMIHHIGRGKNLIKSFSCYLSKKSSTFSLNLASESKHLHAKSILPSRKIMLKLMEIKNIQSVNRNEKQKSLNLLIQHLEGIERTIIWTVYKTEKISN